MPRSPSKLPPFGTESIWEPNRIAGWFGCPPKRAKMLPAASMRGTMSACLISSMMKARAVRSATE